jgi:hypothetical protein
MPDTFSPDVGQHVDPQGHVTYDFDAHLHARGIDLDTVSPRPAFNDNKIRWTNQSDGSVVAVVEGYGQANSRTLSLGAGNNTRIFVQESPGQAPQFQQITLEVPGSLALNLRTLLNGDNESDYLQLAETRDLRVDVFSALFTNVPAGPLWGVSALMPWTHTHNGAAILHVNPSAAWGFTIHPRVDSVTQIEFLIANNPATQDFEINWLSVGH